MTTVELGSDYECDTRDRSNCVLLGKKLEEFVHDRRTTHDEFLKEIEVEFWEHVDEIIKRREVQLRKSHERYLRWNSDIIESCVIGIPTEEEQAMVERVNRLCKLRAEKRLKRALLRSAGKKQFANLYNKTIRDWKKYRDHILKVKICHCVRKNRSLRDIDSDVLMQRRQYDLERELASISYSVGIMSSIWTKVDWLWINPDLIDQKSLNGRTLEDFCFGE